MQTWMRRNSLAALPLAVGLGLLLWIAPIRAERPAHHEGSSDVDGLPPQRPALARTGGPYVHSSEAWGKAFHEAVRRRVVSPRVEKVLATTYGDVLKWTRSGRTAYIGLDREVYLVTVHGPVIVGGGRHPLSSFSRTYYVYDAPTGRLIEWGATILPEPEGSRSEFPQ
jgi:hypothetical protein